MVCQKPPATEGHYFSSLKQPQFWGLIWSLIEIFQTVDYKEDETSPVHFMTFAKKGRLVIRQKNLSDCLKTAKPLNDMSCDTFFCEEDLSRVPEPSEGSVWGQEDLGLGIPATPLNLLLCHPFCELPLSKQEWRDTRYNTTSGIIIVCCSKRYSCGAEGPWPRHAPFVIFLSNLCNHTWPRW